MGVTKTCKLHDDEITYVGEECPLCIAEGEITSLREENEYQQDTLFSLELELAGVNTMLEEANEENERLEQTVNDIEMTMETQQDERE